MNKRVAAVIIKNNRILLMRRIKDGREYFVFPGGGVEKDESIEVAIIREIKEEFSLDIKLEKMLFQMKNKDQPEFYFLVKDFSGILELGGEEKERMNKNDQYYPTWIELDKLVDLDNLYPELAKEKVLGLLISQ